MWCAAITSVVGASYTSISFFKTLHPTINKQYRRIISLFIILSTVLFSLMGNPVRLLIIAGAVNGLILPVGLAVILWASSKKKIVGDYHHPLWMLLSGWLVVLLMTWMGLVTIRNSLIQFF